MIPDKSIHISTIHPTMFHCTQVFVDSRLVKNKTTTAQVAIYIYMYIGNIK